MIKTFALAWYALLVFVISSTYSINALCHKGSSKATLTPFERLTLSDDATKKFASLKDNIATIAKDPRAFWQLANAFDSMVSYCEVTKIDCQAIGDQAHTIFDKKINQHLTWWFDDYGWHGRLFLRLYNLTKDKKFLDAAILSHKHMHAGKNVYNEAAPSIQKEQTPLFDNGCFNYFLVPEVNNFTGIQNTVTNALYLDLVLGLFNVAYNNYLISKDPNDAATSRTYWTYVYEQFHWFKNWFAEGLLNDQIAGPGKYLVEERVSKYRDQSPAFSYEKDRAWGADQGLIVAAMGRFIKIIENLTTDNPLNLPTDGIEAPVLSNTMLGLGSGVAFAMVTTMEGLLESYINEDDDNFPFGDDEDYSPGPGIYLRNVVFSASINDDFKKLISDDDYRDIISANASHAKDQSSEIYDIYDMNLVASDLDKITTALALDVPYNIHLLAQDYF